MICLFIEEHIVEIGSLGDTRKLVDSISSVVLSVSVLAQVICTSMSSSFLSLPSMDLKKEKTMVEQIYRFYNFTYFGILLLLDLLGEENKLVNHSLLPLNLDFGSCNIPFFWESPLVDISSFEVGMVSLKTQSTLPTNLTSSEIWEQSSSDLALICKKRHPIISFTCCRKLHTKNCTIEDVDWCLLSKCSKVTFNLWH